MDRPLFVYGRLRDIDLLTAVLGRRPGAGRALAAVAPGFRAAWYPDRLGAALVRGPGAAATGLVLLDLSPFELEVLDRWQDGVYRRGLVPVMIDEELHEADAYLPGTTVSGGDPWSLDTWQALHKAESLPRAAFQADAIRRKLLAARPH